MLDFEEVFSHTKEDGCGISHARGIVFCRRHLYVMSCPHVRGVISLVGRARARFLCLDVAFFFDISCAHVRVIYFTGKLMSICELIPREFKAPFRDPRSAYRALSPLELFYLLSGIPPDEE